MMTFRSKSCVIGLGVAMFSIWSAMAFASKMPTQIGSTRSPPLSLRITIGMLVMGSTIRPLMVISISIAASRVIPRYVGLLQATQKPRPWLQNGFSPYAVRAGAANGDRNGPPEPFHRRSRRNRKVYDRIALGPTRDLTVAAPARRVHQHRVRAAHHPLVNRRLDFTLQCLECHDARSLVLRTDIIRHPSRCQRIRTLRVLERKHAVISHRLDERQRLLEVCRRFAGKANNHIGR